MNNSAPLINNPDPFSLGAPSTNNPNTSKNPILKISIFNCLVKGLVTSLTFFIGIHLIGIGFSGTELGLVFAASTITTLLGVLPSGFSNDTFKSKNLLTIALILMAAQYIGISFTKDFIPILILFIIGGIGSTLYTTSSDSLFYKSTEKIDVAKKIGIFQSLNYLLIGAGIITAGSLLNAEITFQTLFLFVGIAFTIFAIISQLILPENQTANFEIIQYKKDIFQPKVLFFMIIIFLFTIHYGAENTSYGLFLENYLGLNKLEIGLYMGIAIGIMGPSVLLIGNKLKKFGAKNILIFGVIASGLGHILMTSELIELSFTFRVIHEIGDSAMLFSIYYTVTQFFNLKRIGGNAGIFIFISGIGSTLGSLVFGPIGSIFGYQFPLIISGGILILGGILAIIFVKKYKHQ